MKKYVTGKNRKRLGKCTSPPFIPPFLIPLQGFCTMFLLKFDLYQNKFTTPLFRGEGCGDETIMIGSMTPIITSLMQADLRFEKSSGPNKISGMTIHVGTLFCEQKLAKAKMV